MPFHDDTIAIGCACFFLRVTTCHIWMGHFTDMFSIDRNGMRTFTSQNDFHIPKPLGNCIYNIYIYNHFDDSIVMKPGAFGQFFGKAW